MKKFFILLALALPCFAPATTATALAIPSTVQSASRPADDSAFNLSKYAELDVDFNTNITRDMIEKGAALAPEMTTYGLSGDLLTKLDNFHIVIFDSEACMKVMQKDIKTLKKSKKYNEVASQSSNEDINIFVRQDGNAYKEIIAYYKIDDTCFILQFVGNFSEVDVSQIIGGI